MIHSIPPKMTLLRKTVVFPNRSLTLALFSLIAMLVAQFGTAPLLAQETNSKTDASKQDVQKQTADRRAQRQEAARIRREQRNDPDFIKKNVWWNKEENISKLALTTTQRRKADSVLTEFLEQRASVQERARKAQQDFFGALESGSGTIDRSNIEKKKEEMISALSANTRANADLRIKVLSSLSASQRTTLSQELPRVLRSNWADPGGRRQGMQNNRNRRQARRQQGGENGAL